MSDTAIRVEQLGKFYKIGAQKAKYKTFRDTLAHAAATPARMARSLFSRNGQAKTDDNTFWALKDISFEVKRGEVVGIIGRNGAGKSTLLKILSRITDPTTGFAEIHGRVGSLLEVGTGFHPELTGRENIYLNGAILGMSKADIERRFDEMVAFAEVEKFIDTPVKHYSSGMYLRLAFAVAAHLEPEILLVDEVLAVGDIQFQKKCLGKMSEVAAEGRTVLFVSHNLNAVRSLCTTCVVLAEGQLMLRGTPQAAIDYYVEAPGRNAGTSWEIDELPNSKPAYLESIRLALAGNQPNLVLTADVSVQCVTSTSDFFLAIDVCDKSQAPIMQALPVSKPFIKGDPGNHHLTVEVDLPPLIPGHYTVDFWIGPHYSRTYDYLKNSLAFEVIEGPLSDRSFPHTADHGFLVPHSRCTYKRKAELVPQ